MLPLSVLDSAPIAAGGSVRQAMADSLRLARCAERLGYHRFWLTEHHNMPGMASAATAVCVGYIAGGTQSIRVGAGGIMLANHSPLVVAEQFGTLESLYPSRIDLGLGRASGTDRAAMVALHHWRIPVDRFDADVEDVIAYLWDASPRRGVRAIPGSELRIPIWILGSGARGAALAAALGRPFAFASHFASDDMMAAIDTYRARFTPSAQLAAPHLMMALNVIVADDDREARLRASSLQRAVISLRAGRPEPLQPPVADYECSLQEAEREILNKVLRHAAIGSAEAVREQLGLFVKLTGADELIVASPCFDPTACRDSYALLAHAWLRREERSA